MLYKFIFRRQVINNNLSSAGIAKEYTNSMKELIGDDFTKFSNLLSKEITQNVNGTTQTGKISEFYGLTPMIVVIKNGEAVDAVVGSYSKDNLQTFLKKYIG